MNSKTTQRISNPNFRISAVAADGLVAALHALVGTQKSINTTNSVGNSQVTQRISVCS